MATAEQIGLALSGFSAGVQGQLPQFQQGLVNRQERQQQLSTERVQAAANDVLGVSNFLKQNRPDLAIELISGRVQSGGQLGGDMTESQNLLSALQGIQTPEDLSAVLAEVNDDVSLFTAQGFLEGAQGATADQQTFEALIADFTEEDKLVARRVKAGLDPRAVGSAAQTIAGAGTAEEVGASQAIIKEREKFGELTGASRAKTIDKGFDTIQKISSNILNIDRAINAIDSGASTGVIESRFFPSFRKATLQLEALRKELALDVIGSVTFGALSQGELDLAQEVALPTNLEPADLKQHLVDKKAAQEKLQGYYRQQIDFLDTGGTIAGFLRQQDRVRPGGQADAQVIQFDAQGNIIQ